MNIHPVPQKALLRFTALQPQGASDSCWLWQGHRDPCGYGKFCLRGSYVGAHRVAYALAHGDEIPDGLFVLHTCDVRACVNPNHLYLGTQADSVRDCVLRGRRNRPEGARWQAIYGKRNYDGRRNPNARLTKRQIQQIRRAYSAGVKQYVLAARYGVSQTHISRIVRRLTWNDS